MITTRTPNRISLLGGGTDYPSWVSKHGGICFGGAINKYSYIMARYWPPYHSHKFRLSYSKQELVNSVDEIEHPVIKACINHLGMQNDGLEIMHMSDMPGRCGLGSSSTFTVGLLNALSALKYHALTKDELAWTAIQIEQIHLNECVGYQDQVWAAHGGLNVLQFNKTGEISVFPLGLSRSHIDELNDHLLLVFTGYARVASEVAKSYALTLDQKEQEMFAITSITDLGITALHQRNWEQLGKLIDSYFQIKANLSDKVVNQEIMEKYITGKVAGAFGGKMIGAGGGGCLLFVAPPEKHSYIMSQLPDCKKVPFKFDFTGSQIVICERN